MDDLLSWAPLPLRLAIAAVMMFHGYGKLFGGTSHFAQMLGSMNVPAPSLMAVVVAVVEFFGGLFVFVGFLTRIVAALIAIEMIVAILRVHTPGKAPFSGQGGIEFPLGMLLIAISLVLSGAGVLSIDSLISR